VNTVKVGAVLLAGAPNEGRLKDVSPAPYEALVEVGGRPMIEYVVDALLDAKSIGEIVVLGPEAELKAVMGTRRVKVLPAEGTIIGNVLRGLDALPDGDGRVLVASSDTPLVTGAIIDGLVDLCSQRDGDLYYPVCERKVCDARFPGMKRTYIPLREGTFTGGNILMFNGAVLRRCAAAAARFVAQRKSPVGLASLLGLGFIINLLLRRLTIAGLERKISRMFDLVGVAVVCPFPEIGVDVDKPSDLDLVQGILGGGAATGRG
jgi:CTP:molybdopterin cytidylyltransferase MocA